MEIGDISDKPVKVAPTCTSNEEEHACPKPNHKVTSVRAWSNYYMTWFTSENPPPPTPGRGGAWVNFLLSRAAGLLKPLPQYSRFFGQLQIPVLVIFADTLTTF